MAKHRSHGDKQALHYRNCDLSSRNHRHRFVARLSSKEVKEKKVPRPLGQTHPEPSSVNLLFVVLGRICVPKLGFFSNFTDVYLHNY
jgi:hypothetical protein